MNKTKIDWADSTWNPITGCYHDCEYCYARRIANRFGGHFETSAKTIVLKDKPVSPYPSDFKPTFHKYRLNEPQGYKTPRNIFVCSMADLFGDWVPMEWITSVFNACSLAPQHNYLFLTKNPKRYAELEAGGLLPRAENMWYGFTATNNKDTDKMFDIIFNLQNYNTFLSIEPIMEEPDERMLHDLQFFKWVIVGAETGNRKNKIVPEMNWINSIFNACWPYKAPLFMKESLRGIMGGDFVQENPNELNRRVNRFVDENQGGIYE